MNFDIRDGKTTVTSEMTLVPNTASSGVEDLVLDGDESSVKLLGLEFEGRVLEKGVDYDMKPGKLILKASLLKSGGQLKTSVEIIPEDNTQLSGLYKSGSMYCTQCEAMGFRRITYYPDRPDNMAVFDHIRIEADKEQYPVLLSNGNLVEQGDSQDGRHFAVWQDSFPKPSYLFAAVAGKLGSIQNSFITMSAREVKLEIFSEPENVHMLEYAMEA